MIDRARNRLILFAAVGILMPTVLPALSIDWRNIQFKEGPVAIGDLSRSSDLSAADLEELVDRNTAIFNQQHSGAILIVGHTDSKECSGVECIRLSCDRAIAVYSYLITRGLKHDRVKSVICAGNNSPVAADETAVDRQLNRRVEFVLNKQ